MKLVSEGALKLDDGRDAWGSVLTAKRDDGTTLKINVTVTTFGGRAIMVVAFGTPTDYDDNADGLKQLIGALQLAQPQLFGISRDQALVLSGGESRNPREYDPATTHGSGDKLVYSGLVALDRDLKLIPDLASSWDVKDGTTFTFHIRSDARFHNGKPVTAQDVVYSWERAADPATKSDTVVTYLGDIVGVKDKYDGKARSHQRLEDHRRADAASNDRCAEAVFPAEIDVPGRLRGRSAECGVRRRVVAFAQRHGAIPIGALG